MLNIYQHLAGIRHQEGYPRFDIRVGLAAHRRGDRLCIFQDSERQERGQLMIEKLDPRELQLAYNISGPHLGFGDGRARLQIQSATQTVDQSRHVIFCPGCGRRNYVLWFKDRWACAKCLKLKYRRQLIPRLAAQWERYDKLQAWVGSGRPHGMHNRTFRSLQGEYEQIDEDLAGEDRRCANSLHSYTIEAVWLHPRDVAECILYDYTIRDGELLQWKTEPSDGL